MDQNSNAGIETRVFAARLKDHDRLLKSSSGGAFGALSDVFLDSGNAVVSVIYNYENKQAGFRLYTDRETRDQAIGSKYMQSLPGDIFREVEDWLEKNPEKKLLFFGMGCQAAGFLKYAEVSGFRERVTVVDIICHGSPSPMLWRDYAHRLERQGHVDYITFKDKRNGWKHPSAIALVENNEVRMEDYVRIFYNRCALRPACHKCPYASVERNTDITIGDFWGIENVMMDFYDEAGNSLILIHTSKGLSLFDIAKEAMEYRESSVSDCLQPNLQKPTEISENRSAFWSDYTKHGIDYVIRKYTEPTIQSKVKKKIKNIIGGGNEWVNHDLLLRNTSASVLASKAFLKERSAA